MEEIRTRFTHWNNRFYYVSLFLLLASIPLSKYTTSLSQFMVLGFWLLHDHDLSYYTTFRTGSSKQGGVIKLISGFCYSLWKSLLNKFILFFRNPAALAVASLLLLHVIGLVYTSDFNYALKDLRTKIPLFILPLFLSTGPKLNGRILYLILIGYTLAIVGGTFYRLYLYYSLPVADPRAFDAHISHIRFSLNSIFAVFILIYFIRLKDVFPSWQKVIFFLIIAWLLFFTFYLRYTTGIALFIIVASLLLLYTAVIHSKKKYRWIYFAGGLVITLVPAFYIYNSVKDFRNTEPVSFQSLDKYTLNGNSYYHDTVNFKIEKGQYVGLYICDKELRKAWSARSTMPIDSMDRKLQVLRYTLIRYLASKDLRKDSAGIAQLNNQDIRNIESGLTTFDSQTGMNIKTQIDNFLVGWDNYIHHGNPNSSSLIQRLEYWRTSIILIRQHPIFGVGTGDVPEAFRVQYERMNSTLDPVNRLRSHNQFLSISVAFGLFGLLWFIFVLIYPILKTRNYSYFYFIFFLIYILSIITEDTLETQEGVTFFAFLTSLFLFAWDQSHPRKNLRQSS